jgi:hypothetical protein
MASKMNVPVMIMDSGASILVVSRGYLARKGLSKYIEKGENYEISTADEVVVTKERLRVDLCLPSGPKKHFFGAEVVVLPTTNEIPFLFPMKLLEEWGMKVDFKTGETEWESDGETRQMTWERYGDKGKRCMFCPVEVWPVVGSRGSQAQSARGFSAGMVDAIGGMKQGNGVTPGRARGRE